MKLLKYISYVLTLCVMVLSTFLITSCEEDDNGMHIESPNGPPVISYIRLANPDVSDSLIASANLGTGIVLVGENLGGTREIWFNDKAAPALTPTFVTNQTVFVSVPSQAPDVVTNFMYLVNASSDTLKYPFVVQISPPEIYSAINEWPQEGENLVLNGDFFFSPMTVTFTGGVEGEVVSVTQARAEIKVPEGALEGPVTVETNFGIAVSTFHVWDSRNIILNFDNLVGNGWRTGLTETGDGEIDGNYLVVRGNIAANQRAEGEGASPLLMEYWGGRDASRNDNFYPLYPNSYLNYVLKFEAKVKSWYGGYLNLCLSTPDHDESNQEIWSNSLNARAIWGPWAEAGEEYTTEDKWITVVVPMAEFQYHMGSNDQGVFYTPGQRFVENAAGSFSTWMLGSPENSGNAVEFYIDNIRFVEP